LPIVGVWVPGRHDAALPCGVDGERVAVPRNAAAGHLEADELSLHPSSFCASSAARPLKSPLFIFTIHARSASHGVVTSSMSLP